MNYSNTSTAECPFHDCDWSFEYIEDYDGQLMADMKAERHYEREHCGKARAKIVMTVERTMHVDDSAQQMSDRLHERWEEIAEENGVDLAFTAVEEVEEPDRANKPDTAEESR